MNILKTATMALVAAATAVAPAVLAPTAEAAYPAPPAGQTVYTAPGTWTVNGRDWKTRCEPYTSTITRCFTDIMSSGKWVFNNLTYLPSPRAQWKGNPIGGNGIEGWNQVWNAADGRPWRTECDTAATGRGGCRAYIQTNGKWVFNNMVLFTKGSAPAVTAPATTAPKPTTPAVTSPVAASGNTNLKSCGSVPAIAGFNLDSAGHPYPANNAGYTPVNAFNPIAVANYIQTLGKYTGSNKNCLLTTAGNWVLQNSKVTSYNGRTVRWLPYNFAFSANPASKTLQPGWHSGLGQGGMASAMTVINLATGDAKWKTAGQEIINSLDVPIANGGVKNYIPYQGKKLLWMEEYPVPGAPTTVLNGNNYAIMALDMWAKRYGDPLARKLADEGFESYKYLTPLFDLPNESGAVPASYDLVRGFGEKSALRIVLDSGAKVTGTQFNGKAQYIPALAPVSSAPTVLSNGALNNATGWRTLGGAYFSGGKLIVSPKGSGYVGATQTIAGKALAAGSMASLSWTTRLVKGTAGSPAPMVQVTGTCGGKTVQLTRDGRARGDKFGTYSSQFKVPSGCTAFTVMLAQTISDKAGGTIEFDSVELRRSDWVGSSWTPSYDHFVWRTPVNTVGITGSGQATLQAYRDGRWQHVLKVSLSSSVRTIVLPERFTGRNMNLNYHEGHITEVRNLYSRSGIAILADAGNRWVGAALNTYK